MLFGVSTIWSVASPATESRTFNLLRRFSWLVVFGLIHGVLIRYGDVLLDYASVVVRVDGRADGPDRD